MDLSKLDTATGSEEGRWIEPRDMDGNLIGMRIRVLGPDSRKYGQLRDEVQRDAYRAIASASNGLEPEAEKLTEAEREAQFYARLTLEWESTIDGEAVTWDGKDFPCTEANVKKLYHSVVIVRNQVKLFVESRRNFTRPASGDSGEPSKPALNSNGRAKRGRSGSI